MLILPSRGNYFTKKMWQEKLALKPLQEKDKKKLRAIYKGKRTDKNFVDLVCDENKCVYKDKVTLLKDGGISVKGEDYSDKGALSIFLKGDKVIVKTVTETVGNRYWNKFK